MCFGFPASLAVTEAAVINNYTTIRVMTARTAVNWVLWIDIAVIVDEDKTEGAFNKRPPTKTWRFKVVFALQ
jgi:hypothetical protein